MKKDSMEIVILYNLQKYNTTQSVRLVHYYNY